MLNIITGGFSGGGGGGGGRGGVRTPPPPTSFMHPQHVLHPPQHLLAPPNIFAPYPRNYSIRGQAAYVPPNDSFLQLQTTPTSFMHPQHVLHPPNIYLHPPTFLLLIPETIV